MSESWSPGDLCKWRRPGKVQWQKSHVLGVMSDRDGSVKIWDKRTGFPAYVPNSENCIVRRTK